MQEQLFISLISRLESFGLALIVLIFGWLIAKVMSKIIHKILVTIKIDNLANSLDKIDFIKKSDLKFKLSLIISKLVYYVLLLIIIALSADILSLDIISEQIDNLVNYLPKLLSGFLVFIGGLLIANLVKDVIAASFKSIGIAAGSVISKFIFYFLVITVSLSALTQAEIETSFITSNLTIIIGGIVAAFAIGYGLASRGIMSNLLGSLYSKQKFQPGDVIKVRGVRGQIINIDNTSITLQTEEKRVIIPLSRLSTEDVEIYGTWEDNKLID